MYAVHNGCDRFVTTDPDFLDRRLELEALGKGILTRRPSELAAELFPVTSADQRSAGVSDA